MEACYGRAVQGEGSFGTSFPRTVNAGISQSCSTLTRTTPTNVRRGICKGSKLAADEGSPRAIGSTGAPSLLMVVFAAGTSSYGRTYHLNTDISWIMKLRYSYHPGQQHGTTDLVYSGSVILLIWKNTCYRHIFTNQCHTRPPTFSVVFAVDTSCYGRTYHFNTDTSWIMKLRYSYHPGQQHGTTDLVPFGSVILWILIKIGYRHIFSNHCYTRPPTFSVVLSLDQEWVLRTPIPGPHHTKGPLTPFYFSSAAIDPGPYATDNCYTIMMARTGLPDPYY
jgi:hypothetical protein